MALHTETHNEWVSTLPQYNDVGRTNVVLIIVLVLLFNLGLIAWIMRRKHKEQRRNMES